MKNCFMAQIFFLATADFFFCLNSCDGGPVRWLARLTKCRKVAGSIPALSFSELCQVYPSKKGLAFCRYLTLSFNLLLDIKLSFINHFKETA